jgi:hypothetical protein
MSSQEQIVQYHLRALITNEQKEQEKEGIPTNYCHIHLLEKAMTDVHYSNNEYKTMFETFVCDFLRDDYVDCVADSNCANFEEYLENSFLPRHDDDAYRGNGAYDAYELTHNLIRKMLVKFRK